MLLVLSLKLLTLLLIDTGRQDMQYTDQNDLAGMAMVD